MDEDVLLREIMKSLAFEIEAVNQDNVLKWTCTNGTPLSVKVRVRNKDEPRLVQRGAIPVPRIGITAPEQLTLVSSEQTILSFRVFMENELKQKEEEKRHGGFRIFNIGSCLGTYSDDEGPYLPSSSHQKALESDSDTKSSSGNLNNKTLPIVSSSKTVPRVHKRLFGKCKPGGCLDPPFGEDNYAYDLPKPDRQEKLRHEINALEDKKKSCKPGGCLDPPFGEEKQPYIPSKQDKQNQEIELRGVKDSTENETISQKKTKDEVDSKNITNIYARVPEENTLEYTDSIITYPIETSSNETLHNQAQSKKLSIKSINNESLRQSYEYPESYFVPPKDVIRYKDEERRQVRKTSTEHFGRGSKVSTQDIIKKSRIKSKSDEFKNITQKIIKSKDLPKENIKVAEISSPKAMLPLLTPELKAVTSSSKYMDETSQRTSIKNENNFHSANVEILDSKDARTKDILKLNYQPPRVSETLKNTDTLRPGAHQVQNCDKVIPSEEIGITGGIAIGTAAVAAIVSERKTVKSKDKSNNDIPNATEEKLIFPHKTHQREGHVLSGDIADTKNSEADASTANMIDFKQKRSSINSSILDKLNQKKKHLSPTRNEIIEKQSSVGSNVSEKLNQKKKNLSPTRNRTIEKQSSTGSNVLDDLIQKKKGLSPTRNRTIERQSSAGSNVLEDPIQQTKRLSPTRNRTIEKQSSTGSNNLDDLIQKKERLSPTRNRTIERQLSTISNVLDDEIQKKKHLSPTRNRNIEKQSSAGSNVLDDLIQKKKGLSPTRNRTIERQSSTGSNVLDDRIQKRERLSPTRNRIIEKQPSTGSNVLDDLIQKKKRLSPTRNIIIEKQGLQNNHINKSPDLEENKTSVILQKKPFTTRHDSVIHDDDNNRTTPLKRNTFTITGSDTSLKNHEDIEERVESVTDVPVKIRDKISLGPLSQTEGNKTILDKVSKKSENKIDATDQAEKKYKEENTRDAYIKDKEKGKPLSTEQISEKEKSLNQRSENPPGNDFITDSKIPQKNKQEIIANLGPTNYQEKASDSPPKNKMDTDSLLKPPLRSTTNSYSNLVDSTQRTLTNQSPHKSNILDAEEQMIEYAKYRDLPMEDTKIRNNFESPAQPNDNDIEGSAFDPLRQISPNNKSNVSYTERTIPKSKDIYEDLGTDLIQSENNLQPSPKVTEDGWIRGDRTELSDGENQNLENPKHGDLDSFRKTIPEKENNAYRTVLDYNSSFVQRPENVDIEDKKNKNDTYSSTQGLENKSDWDVISNQKNVPEHVNKMLPLTTDDLNSKRGLRYEKKIQRDNLKYSDSAVDNVLKNESDKIHDLYPQPADNNQYVFSDQKYDKTHTYLDSTNYGVDEDKFNIANEKKEMEKKEEAVSLRDIKMEKENIRYSVSNPDISENPIEQIMDDDRLVSGDLKTDRIDYVDTRFQPIRNKSDTDLISTQHFITKQGSESYSVITDKYDEMGLRNQIHQKPAADFSQKVKPDDKYALSEHINYKEDFSKSNKPNAELDTADIFDTGVKIPENIDYEEKTRSVSQNNSPFSGPSGVISEVLSNISENIEAEEKISTRSLGPEQNKKYKSITKLDSGTYRDQGILDSKYTNIANEPAYIASTSASDYIGDIHKLKYDSYDAPRDSFIKSSMPTFREGDGSTRTGKKVFEATELVPDSSYKLKRHDYSSDILTKDHILDQLDSNINKSNLDGTPTASLKKKKSPLYLDMSFYSYMNDNNQRVVQTKSPLIDQRQPDDGTVTVVKTLIRPGNEIRIPVDKENDLFLNILDEDVKKTHRDNAVGAPLRSPRREKYIVDRAKRHDEVLNKNLALIYEYDLIPLHRVIRDLTQEVNTLSTQQEKLQMRMRNTKRTKSLRLIPVVKRCGCRRM